MRLFFRHTTKHAVRLSQILCAILLCASVASFAPAQALAAGTTFSFDAPSRTVGVGDQFTLSLKLAAGDTAINAISGDIVFSDSNLTLVRILTAGSIVTSWVEAPVASGNSVTFSGIMPGGYENVIDPVTNTTLSATVLTLVFSATASGMGSVAFTDAHAYLNDGLGTETAVATAPSTFPISATGASATVSLADTTPPLAFTPVVSSSPDIYNGAYALFFSTTDKESGIDHYEVSEGTGDWVRAQSPYLLTDQTLRSAVRVKAVDEAGNFTIGTTGAAPSSLGASLLLIPTLFILIILAVLYFIYKKFMNKFKKKS